MRRAFAFTAAGAGRWLGVGASLGAVVLAGVAVGAGPEHSVAPAPAGEAEARESLTAGAVAKRSAEDPLAASRAERSHGGLAPGVARSEAAKGYSVMAGAVAKSSAEDPLSASRAERSNGGLAPGVAGSEAELFATAPAAALARSQGPEGGYTGIFTFMRIQYGQSGGMRGFGRRSREPPWAHDWPYAETNFTKILDATTTVGPYLDAAGQFLTLDDPEVFKFPIIYLVEVGSWRPSDSEVMALREFLLKGGFLIVDDFRDGAIYNFQDQMQRVLPGAELFQVEDQHEIFNSFFHIPEPLAFMPPYGRSPPIYLGFFEENDPSKRLMAMVNYNQDHMEYWEFSDRGYYPIDLSNDAYKFGVNYVIYGMTH